MDTRFFLTAACNDNAGTNKKEAVFAQNQMRMREMASSIQLIGLGKSLWKHAVL